MRYKGMLNKLFTVAIVGIMIASASICVFAKTGTYGAFILTYNCTVSSTKGKATTSGAAKPYYNCALVTVYNKKGKSKGNASSYMRGGTTATANKSGIGLKKAKSCHSVTNANKTQLEISKKQLTAQATR